MGDVLVGFFEQFRDDFLIVLVGAAFALVRAMGTTIETGQTGLLFSFGRARKTLEPGFHLLIPFLQKARRLPTRSRTLDLPAQRVATFEGLVYHVDANLVYRVVDVRKALIEIDELEKGMLQMLGLGVQEILRGASATELRNAHSLDAALIENLERRLAPWGVTVENAGFPSVTPSDKTLRITQIARVADERRGMLTRLEAAGITRARALGLVGARTMPLARTRALRRLEEDRRRNRHLRKALMHRGWTRVKIKDAGRSIRKRVTSRGRLKARKPKKEIGAK